MRCQQKWLDARHKLQAMVIPLPRFVTPQKPFLLATLREGVIFTYCCVAVRLFGITKLRFTASCTTKKIIPVALAKEIRQAPLRGGLRYHAAAFGNYETIRLCVLK
jgi:hypothetical protein